MDEIGPEGQARLLDTNVLIVGAGGLGSPVIQYLAAAGIGTIGVVDNDVVERSNLQRQVIHRDVDLGDSKVNSAARFIADVNPDITVKTHQSRVDKQSIRETVPEYDIVVDASDNFPTRYLLNDFCRFRGIPIAHGAIYKFEGQLTTLVPDGPCYRCLFPEAPEPGTVPDCAATGVLGVLPGTVGCLQATEVVKLILDTGNPLIGELVFYDALETSFEQISYQSDPACPVCGDGSIQSIESVEYTSGCNVGE
jgi:Dinucleotide-utilizing enzymes involved in molybdopterin and thiamine biosynthesis family 2